MYDNVRTVVKTKDENSEEFKVEAHREALPSPLLFVVVMKALICEARE